jgi:urease subunit alpha
MFGAFGKSRGHGSVTFVSGAAAGNGLREKLGVSKALVGVSNTRNIGKASMIHNTLTPNITVDPETYEVRIDGALITCEPASVLPMAQRYFLY